MQNSTAPFGKEEFSAESYQTAIAWVDSMELSRPKKNLAKDFSDGVLMAEILKSYFPKQVELHNYVVANSTATKVDNWLVLNRKVLKKLGISISRKTMNNLAKAVPGAIQKLLVVVHNTVRSTILAESNQQVYVLEDSSDNVRRESTTTGIEVFTIPIKSSDEQTVIGQKKVVSLAAYEKKRAELIAKTEEAENLSRRVEHLESMIDLKDKRIKYLNSQVYHDENVISDVSITTRRFSKSLGSR